MLGNFMYCNPTKLYFGEDSITGLNEELPSVIMQQRDAVCRLTGGHPSFNRNIIVLTFQEAFEA